MRHCFPKFSELPNPPDFSQPGLSRSPGGHPLSLASAKLPARNPEETSEAPPNHVRTTSEPRPNRLRNNGPQFREKWFLARSSGGHPHRKGTNLGVFVSCMAGFCPRLEPTDFGVFDLCLVDRLKRGCANSAGLGAR